MSNPLQHHAARKEGVPERQQALLEHLQRLDEATRAVTSFQTWTAFRRECGNGLTPWMNPREASPPAAAAMRLLLSELRGRGLAVGSGKVEYDAERPSATPAPNYAGLVLIGFDFSGEDLSGASFAGAILRCADFSGALLKNADFTGATLDGACFASAELIHANLSQTTGDRVNFVNAILEGTIFDAAKFTAPDFSYARAAKTSSAVAVFSHASLLNAELTGGDFTSALFIDANLSGAKMSPPWPTTELTAAERIHTKPPGYMAGATFASANLTRANLTGADLSEANFTKANLFEADLSDTTLARTDLRNANLDGAMVEGAFCQDVLVSEPHLLGVPERVEGRQAEELVVNNCRLLFVTTSRHPDYDAIADRACLHLAKAVNKLPSAKFLQLRQELASEPAQHPAAIHVLSLQAVRFAAPRFLKHPEHFVRCHLEVPGTHRESPGLRELAPGERSPAISLLTTRRRESDAQLDGATARLTDGKDFSNLSEACKRGFTPTLRIQHSDSMETIREKDLVAAELLAAGHRVFDGVRTIQPDALAADHQPTAPRSTQRSQVRDLDEDHELSR